MCDQKVSVFAAIPHPEEQNKPDSSVRFSGDHVFVAILAPHTC